MVVRIKKQKKKNIHKVLRRLELFTIPEIRLHKRVFIITLDITKLQKYLYTLNISYRTAGAPHPIISPSNKDDML